MLKNYLKTAFRSLWRNKRYAFLNITGLSLGITVCLVIYVIIQYEQGFDMFHTKKDRIYRVLTVSPGENGKTNYSQAIPFPVPTTLPNDFPEFEQVAGIIQTGKRLVTLEDGHGNIQKKFKPLVYFLPPSFFNIFDYKWLAGNKATALNDPNSTVLARSTAEKYFGDWHKAIGQVIKLDQHFDLTVTGILDDPPKNTEFQFEMVATYALLKINEIKDWVTIDDVHNCYVLVRPGQDIAKINRRLIAFSQKYKDPKNKATHMLQPLAGVHSDKRTANFIGRVVPPERISMLWMIAGFILLIACVNFINLATAQAVNRAREIGVRKVLGSNRWQLKIQFLSETAMLVLTSLLLAVLLALCGLPFISRVMDLPLGPGMLATYDVYAILLLIFLTVTLLAGFYPSIVVSAFNPINALKSKIAASKRNGGISLRRSLVVIQFVIAQALIIGTLIILQQMNYFNKQSMGFTRDAIVNVPFRNDSAGNAKIPYLRDQLQHIKGIQEVSFSAEAPSNDGNWWTGFKFDHQTEDVNFAAVTRWVDYNFLNTYDIRLVAGRNLTRTDSVREFLVNETLVQKLGLKPADVLNKDMDVWDGRIKGPIVGVVKDFAAGTLKEAVAPVFMSNIKRRFGSVGVRLAAGADAKASLKAIEKLWSDNFPEQIFEYQFLDERIAAYYKEERQLAHLYEIFAGIAIFLSCLGLYGLASFMAVQRVKEVGVRKVLGATPAHIVYLFSKEFILLIGIAFIIATPLVWYFMHNWLNNFVNRVDINWGVFVAGGMAAVVIALITVSSQAIRAAMMNPVNSLKAD
ncbi:FtsX-like permease family protein [Chitinophaga agrisoli]|uniref:FtsX-like permease family protein n=1 Tax=Chitinophaga agrisoli TaxID=2607653 RepID=A0A5B2VM57_9BACT|nr:ABC transporter permease [Chitinophaga agrisoli]KAA2239357.1 FtsX-like permease family protein [Chitinophaga agrisoli]